MAPPIDVRKMVCRSLLGQRGMFEEFYFEVDLFETSIVSDRVIYHLREV